ncbi:dimethylsulfonioproprionate lyase family protein [Phyllobacterium chamaecytisi]|uniref:dimethylsulfonioproprionate lyase family protein n=1 Tax=Phyllobacterium chamaecytisi TaxID=2876082 RepID=UPI001CCAB85B|nr:cupin domain-containing protein [Phyllobacterium sp. KW56]
MAELNRAGAEVSERLARLVLDLLMAMAVPERFLNDWPALNATRRGTPQQLPVLAWLDELADRTSPILAPLLKEISRAAPKLEWRQTYKAEDFGPEFLNRYGWTELIGLRGPIASTKIACGILLLGPELLYPAHAHEAEEIYVCLGGAAAWMRGDEPFTSQPPGTIIHHPSWMPHAMRTSSKPLVALYVWRGGDLAAKSKIIAPS